LGDIRLGGRTVKGSFKVFPSGGGWSLLFGKPLLRAFEAVHDYRDDTLKIPLNGAWTTLTNECREAPAVETVIKANAKLESLINTAPMVSLISAEAKRRPGRRARDKQKRNAQKQSSKLQEWWNSVWTIRDTDVDSAGLGDLQPEVEINSDNSLFTRATDPHNPQRVAEVLKHVSIGSDLTDQQRHRVRSLISEFADCFALSVREVLPIPGAEHRIHIPPDVIFPKKIPHQRQLTEAQRAYLSDAIDELLAADIIEPIRPEDVKCASPITLAQKVHSNPGLSFDELRHRVNEECISHGLPPAHNVEPPAAHTPTPSNNTEMAYDPTQPQKWRICQNYGALNRVTQVFPMPQGDIRTKQRRLSGHRWIHGFDFASGFYAVTVPEALRPYLVFYVEGRGFHT
jgi:hypothetical protein